MLFFFGYKGIQGNAHLYSVFLSRVLVIILYSLEEFLWTFLFPHKFWTCVILFPTLVLLDSCVDHLLRIIFYSLILCLLLLVKLQFLIQCFIGLSLIILCLEAKYLCIIIVSWVHIIICFLLLGIHEAYAFLLSKELEHQMYALLSIPLLADISSFWKILLIMKYHFNFKYENCFHELKLHYVS